MKMEAKKNDNSRKVITLDKHTQKIKGLKDSPNEITELNNRLISISNMLGVRVAPTWVEIDDIIKHIIQGFEDFSIEEISNAFTFALAGKLEVDPETYQSFDIPYVSRILVAYRKHRKQCIDNYNKTQVKEPPEANSIRSKQLIKECRLLYCREITKYFETGHYNIFDWGNAFWLWLEKEGLASFSIEEKNRIFKQAEKEMKYAKEGETAIKISRRMALRKFLDDCKKTKRDIVSEIKAKLNLDNNQNNNNEKHDNQNG